MIDDFIRDRGVTVCPPRTYSEGLVRVGASTPESKAASRRIQARQRRFANAGRDKAPPTPETERLIELAKTMTTAEIGEAVNMCPKAVARRLRRHGVEPLTAMARNAAQRRETVRVMMADGARAADIAARTGANQQTIYDDIKLLVEQGHSRKPPKSGPVIADIGERRRRVRGLRDRGLSLAQIGRECGVSVSAIRHDLRMMEGAADA